MGAAARLAGYAAAVAVVAAAAAGLGYAVGPLGSAKDEVTEEHAGESHGETAASGLGIADGRYRLVLDGGRLPTGRAASVGFRILDASGSVVRDFDEEGGVRMHLIVVRRDLTGYRHLHPEQQEDGSWTTELTLPAAGVYRAFADFEREGDRTVLGADLLAPGRFDPEALPAPEAAVEVDGYDVTLDRHPGELVFRVTRDGAPAELDPYLGARGHLVALRAGDLAYLHVHPLRDADRGEIAFAATFPTPGAYRLFLQFSDGGEVHTAAFTLEVAQ